MKLSDLRLKIEALENKSIEKTVLRFLSAWSFASTVYFLIAGMEIDGLTAFRELSFSLFLGIFCLAFVLMTAVSVILKRYRFGFSDAVFLPLFFGAYSLLTAFAAQNEYYVFVLTALWAILLFYYRARGWLLFRKEWGAKKERILLAVFAGVFLFFVGGVGVLRHLTYRTPNFDFGIFTQMFYNMRKGLGPVTTVERDKLLSHFAVHLSPVYYLLLPVFALFPSPLTLQISQAVILASAVIPLCLLCKEKGVSRKNTAFLGFILLFFPAVYSGTYYDIHENCFLLPLLLWTFYFFEKNRTLLTLLFVVLTLFVKEDAAVYILFFALFVILDRKKYGKGALFAGIGVCYFLFALVVLNSYGEGIMTGRYQNFITDGGGLFSAVKNVLMSPGYAFTQIFEDKDGTPLGKVTFLLQIFVPLAFLPVNVKKPSRLLLLLPMLLFNLLTVYPYQYDIGYQYTFGSTAFLFYLSVLNFSEMKKETGELSLSVAAVCCALCAVTALVPKYTRYYKAYVDEKAQISLMNETLKEIDREKSVIASTMLIPHLSDREELYEVNYHRGNDPKLTDLVILDCRNAYEEYLEKYLDFGYVEQKTVRFRDRPLIIILERGEEHAAL